MNGTTVWRLLLKDWYLNRIAALLTLLGSLASIVLLAMPGSATLSLGASLTMGVLIALTFHLPLDSVLREREQKTLTFMMSLPVSTSEYVASKILANLSLFLLPWLTIVAGIWVVFRESELPPARNGFVPVILLGMVVGFSFILAFALITESGGWTVALIVSMLFICSNVFTQVLPRIEAFSSVLKSISSRGPAFQAVLAAEMLLILSLLGATFLIQSRKKDFL